LFAIEGDFCEFKEYTMLDWGIGVNAEALNGIRTANLLMGGSWITNVLGQKRWFLHGLNV